MSESNKSPAEGSDDLAERLRHAETWDLDADQEARDRCGVLMLEAAERLENLPAHPPAPAEAGEDIDWKAEFETLCSRNIKDREAIARIIDPQAFVPMEDIIGMRKAYVKADAILGFRAQPQARTGEGQ